MIVGFLTCATSAIGAKQKTIFDIVAFKWQSPVNDGSIGLVLHEQME
ncbi:hypothetical protein L901_03320 [Agrobacterium sp. D14]|nr:hypothetical protein L901_03320 [Agrobacterium sp. D14]